MRILNSNGSAGIENNTVNSTEVVISSSCAGSSGSNSLTATGSFVAGQKIFIYQARGTNVGYIEMNQVQSYSTGTITTVHKLGTTYSSTGDSKAFVQVVNDLSGFINSATLEANGWNGTVGGVLFRATNGIFWNKTGATLDLKGKGYRGGSGVNQNVNPSQGQQGEGTTGDRSYSQSANGNSGGGGRRTVVGGGVDTGGAGAGAHASAGTSGFNIGGSSTGGTGGAAVGSSDFNNGIFFGGSGGAAPGNDEAVFKGGYGGNGGAIAIIICDEFINDGTIDVRGNDPDNSPHGGNQDGDAAPGAGGSLWVIARKYTNRGTIIGVQGTYVTGGTIGPCGAASTGRMQVDTCQIGTGNVVTNPVSTNEVGGHSFCGAVFLGMTGF